MARLSSSTTTDIRHSDKRLNNPPAAIAGEGAVPVAPKFEFSAHRPPALRFAVYGETVTEAADLLGMALPRPIRRRHHVIDIDQGLRWRA